MQQNQNIIIPNWKLNNKIQSKIHAFSTTRRHPIDNFCNTTNFDQALEKNQLILHNFIQSIDYNIHHATMHKDTVNSSTCNNINQLKHLDANYNKFQMIDGQNNTLAQISTNWIKQVHGNHILEITQDTNSKPHNIYNRENNLADAIFTLLPNTACIILTADCLPILLCDKNANFVMAIHAGWRGVLSDIIELSIEKITKYLPINDVIAWIGPSISGKKFEVGREVQQLFYKKYHKDINLNNIFSITNDLTRCNSSLNNPYRPNSTHSLNNHKYLCDLVMLASCIMRMHGINNIYHANMCTHEDEQNFFSHRRGRDTARMASVIWRME